MTYQVLNPTTGEIVRTLDSAAIRRLQAAERRANRRDFDLRYGSRKRHPYGVSPARRPRKQANALAQLLIGIGATVTAAFIIHSM